MSAQVVDGEWLPVLTGEAEGPKRFGRGQQGARLELHGRRMLTNRGGEIIHAEPGPAAAATATTKMERGRSPPCGGGSWLMTNTSLRIRRVAPSQGLERLREGLRHG